MNTVHALNLELAGIVAGGVPGVVQVMNGRGDQRGNGRPSAGAGAGTIWHEDGLIVTNAHVVAPSARRGQAPTVVLQDGRGLEARIIAFDEKHDLAALVVDAHGLPALTLGDSRAVAVGDWVTAIGHPWGVRNAVTSGAVIAVGRATELRYAAPLIQIGLHMRPGHSGGALLDSDGRLVGINCMIAGPDVGLAVPVNAAKRLLRRTV